MLATDLAQAGLLFVCGVGLIILLIVSWRQAVGTVMTGVACALTVTVFADLVVGSTSYRSFFGVNKVYESQDGQYRYIRHGSTIHGAMRIRTAEGEPVVGRPEPLTYYTPEGSNALGIDAIRQVRGGKLNRVAAVGLGSGSIACLIGEGEDWTFFEIDPVVTRIATNPSLFRFMSECAPKAAVVHGDVRLTLQKVEKPFDMIFLDAFSSDSIPAHLVTVEAIQSYLEKLSPGGAIVLHVSNRHLDLRAIVARVAAEAGLVTYAGATNSSGDGAASSVTLVVARQEEGLGELARTWTLIQPDWKRSPWTDDYSNVLEGIRDAWLGPKVDEVLIKPVQSADVRN